MKNDSNDLSCFVYHLKFITLCHYIITAVVNLISVLVTMFFWKAIRFLSFYG